MSKMKIQLISEDCDMEMCQNETLSTCQDYNIAPMNYKTTLTYDTNQEKSVQKHVVNKAKEEEDSVDQVYFSDDYKSYKEFPDRNHNHIKYDQKKILNKSQENISNIKCTTDNSIITPIKETIQISYNPFEVKPESLQLLSCSPSVFATFQTSDKKTKTFRWSIDQIATLKPAEIDETSQQDTGLDYDAEMEEKAQKAIENFFSRNNVVPSPWGTLAKHVTFSPNLASTAYYANAEESLNTSQPAFYIQNISKKNVWTQTQLTIPPHVDIMAILGPAFTFRGDDCQVEDIIEAPADADSFGNCSLRRKLFSHGNESTPTGVIQKHVPSMKLWSPSIVPQVLVPPEENSHICTPGSTQISSSPITPRNCSMSIGVHVSPPSVSPIGKSIFKTPSTGSRSDGIDILPDSSLSTNKQELVRTELLPLSPMNVCCPNDWKSSTVEDNITTGIQKVEEKDMFHYSVTDMSCDESMTNHNNYSEVPVNEENADKVKISIFNFVKESANSSNCHEMESQGLKKCDDQFESNPNSMAQDTGYQTASLQSITQSSQGGMRTEFGIVDSVMMRNSVQYENINIFQNEIDSKDYIHKEMKEKDKLFKDDCKTNVQTISFQEHYSANVFNSLPWQPTKCSTPTKMHVSEVKYL